MSFGSPLVSLKAFFFFFKGTCVTLEVGGNERNYRASFKVPFPSLI